MRSKKTAFTLIELLVVIAIIALLLAVLLPALSEVKKRAMGLYCLANLRGLSLAWTLYADQNDGKLVSGEVWGNYGNVKPFDWVHPVISTSDPLYTTGMSENERELAGITERHHRLNHRQRRRKVVVDCRGCRGIALLRSDRAEYTHKP